MIRAACLLLISALATSACTTAPSGDLARASSSRLDAASTLPRYEWRLVSASDGSGQRIGALFAQADKPLALLFIDGRMAIANGCNRLGADYRVEGHRLLVGHMISTMMACPDAALMEMDRAAAIALTGTHTLALAAGPAPRLTLNHVAGSTLVFTGAASAEVRAGATSPSRSHH